MLFLLRKRSSLYTADTSSQWTLFTFKGPSGVRYKEVSLHAMCSYFFQRPSCGLTFGRAYLWKEFCVGDKAYPEIENKSDFSRFYRENFH